MIDGLMSFILLITFIIIISLIFGYHALTFILWFQIPLNSHGFVILPIHKATIQCCNEEKTPFFHPVTRPMSEATSVLNSKNKKRWGNMQKLLIRVNKTELSNHVHAYESNMRCGFGCLPHRLLHGTLIFPKYFYNFLPILN